VVDWCDWYGRGGIYRLREEIRAYQGMTKGWRLAIQRWAERREEGLEEEIVKFADAVTVISRALEDRAVNLGVSRTRLLRFPSGAPLDQIAPLDKQECRRKLGMDPGLVLFGYVANYHPDEHFFLEAVGKALRVVKGARLVVAGPPFTDGLAEDYGVEEGLMWVGRRPFGEIPTWLGACDVLLLPLADNISNRGRWPNKIGDYLASGRPIVTNRVGDAPEYVERGGAGIVTEPTAGAFADGIVAAAQQKHRWATWGREARAIAERELSWSRLNDQVADFLERLELLRR
ncbi:MAG: glycosyltransferase, partial [bacterium]